MSWNRHLSQIATPWALRQKPQRGTKRTKDFFKLFALFVLYCGLARQGPTFEAKLPPGSDKLGFPPHLNHAPVTFTTDLDDGILLASGN